MAEESPAGVTQGDVAVARQARPLGGWWRFERAFQTTDHSVEMWSCDGGEAQCFAENAVIDEATALYILKTAGDMAAEGLSERLQEVGIAVAFEAGLGPLQWAAGALWASRATRGAPKLLGQPITWEAKDLARVINKHGPDISGKGGVLKSRFNVGEDIAALIKSGTHQKAVVQEGSRNMIRTFDTRRIIGTDVVTGGPTSIMNVVTSPSGRLVTAFPGTP